MRGKVFLVGAGPGDPGLITVRGHRLLSEAQVVVVDALVDPALFRSLKARVIYVGKRGPGAAPGRSAELTQTGINNLLLRLARQGKKVVRLKGGDPFVFGRGGEEFSALKRAGISVEVVPGVSSVTGVPTFAGIPLTDRSLASQVTFITGQSKENDGDLSPRIDWESLSPRQTLVVLMGVSRWLEISRRLIKEGWPVHKPVAAIEWGATHRQRVLETKLGDSAAFFRRQKLSAPAVIVVGDVARLRKRFFGKNMRPLEGRRIAVTRPIDQSAAIMRMLEQQGAETVLCPSIQVKPLRIKLRLRLPYDWVVFLSANAVKTFTAKIKTPALFKKTSVLAVGTETQRVAEALGWKVTQVPRQFSAQGAVAALGRVRGKRILLPRAQGAPRDPVVAWRRRGATVDEVALYRTAPAPLTAPMKEELFMGVDGISFTSSSTVKSFLRSLTKLERRVLFGRAAVFSIGRQTTATLKRGGVRQVRQASESTTAGLVKTMANYFGVRR